MVLDTDTLLNDAEGEKDDDDIAIINPDDEVVPRADDCMIPHSKRHTTRADCFNS